MIFCVILAPENTKEMIQVWISAAGLSLSTIIGALLGFVIKALPHKWNDAVLGFCAGIMLAASTIGLIVPAAESAGIGKWWLILIGVVAGMLFLNLLDFVTPHLHKITGLDSEEHKNNASLNHVLLFVMAIALHKLPEGIAAINSSGAFSAQRSIIPTSIFTPEVNSSLPYSRIHYLYGFPSSLERERISSPTLL